MSVATVARCYNRATHRFKSYVMGDGVAAGKENENANTTVLVVLRRDWDTRTVSQLTYPSGSIQYLMLVHKSTIANAL